MRKIFFGKCLKVFLLLSLFSGLHGMGSAIDKVQQVFMGFVPEDSSEKVASEFELFRANYKESFARVLASPRVSPGKIIEEVSVLFNKTKDRVQELRRVDISPEEQAQIDKTLLEAKKAIENLPKMFSEIAREDQEDREERAKSRVEQLKSQNTILFRLFSKHIKCTTPPVTEMHYNDQTGNWEDVVLVPSKDIDSGFGLAFYKKDVPRFCAMVGKLGLAGWFYDQFMQTRIQKIEQDILQNSQEIQELLEKGPQDSSRILKYINKNHTLVNKDKFFYRLMLLFFVEHMGQHLIDGAKRSALQGDFEFGDFPDLARKEFWMSYDKLPDGSLQESPEVLFSVQTFLNIFSGLGPDNGVDGGSVDKLISHAYSMPKLEIFGDSFKTYDFINKVCNLRLPGFLFSNKAIEVAKIAGYCFAMKFLDDTKNSRWFSYVIRHRKDFLELIKEYNDPNANKKEAQLKISKFIQSGQKTDLFSSGYGTLTSVKSIGKIIVNSKVFAYLMLPAMAIKSLPYWKPAYKMCKNNF